MCQNSHLLFYAQRRCIGYYDTPSKMGFLRDDYIHPVHYDAFRQVSHVRPLYPVAFGNFIKHRFLELSHDRTFLVKHIKTAFVMKYLNDLPVPGHEHIYIAVSYTHLTLPTT